MPKRAIQDSQAALEIVQREIAACTLCIEAGFIPMSRPVFQGHVGQAPGPSSGQRGAPYTGATGKTLQRLLAIGYRLSVIGQ